MYSPEERRLSLTIICNYLLYLSAMRIDSANEIIKLKGYTLTFDETKVVVKKYFANICAHYVIRANPDGTWVVDWISVFKHCDETKILNVVLWEKLTNRN